MDEAISTPSPKLSYKQKMDAAIRDLLLEYECQPILFVGSGIPRRYFSAPSWMELLEKVFEMMPDSYGTFQYYSQKYDADPIKIGSELSEIVFEWAWREGRGQFPAEFFASGIRKDQFLKFLCCKLLEGLTPKLEDLKESVKKETDALASIRPHAIITTNYDLFLEEIFDGYQPITGQTILRYSMNSFGEIYHIHGDIGDPGSIVLTQMDYDEWADKKKYVSAKLLTYFAEHPVFIFGYSLGDHNVKTILGDIGEIVADETGLIPNVYQVVFASGGIPESPPEQTIFSAGGREFRINAIYTSDFQWVFEALKSRSALTSVNAKLVRALAARTMKLVRHDIPSGTVSVDYDILERVAEHEEELPKLLGITTAINPNQTHPLSMTQVAKRLGFAHWSPANRLIKQIIDEKGTDLRASDNSYHCQIKTGPGKNSKVRKWSHRTVDLLQKVRDGLPYDLDL